MLKAIKKKIKAALLARKLRKMSESIKRQHAARLAAGR
jgi:hypothetical protein